MNNCEKTKNYQKGYYNNHKEERKRNNDNWRENNRERYNKRAREYRQKQKEKINNYIVTIEVLESEKENLTRTLEEANELIEDARDIVEWLATHNKNYTKEQYNKILDLQDLVNNL